jgi:YegS/Rv2252/BmrU family lipid kinase
VTANHLLIINPRSRGSTGRRWRQAEGRLRASLPPFDTVFTKSPGDATRLAAKAVGRYEVIVAVGGDGSTNEVVNGLISRDGNVSAGVALGIIPSGTGGDLPRSLGIPRSPGAAAAILARGRRREVDVGRARFLGFDRAEVTRYFINEAEVGMGAAVCQAVNRSSGRLGGAGTFLWGILVTMFRHRDRPVSFSADGGPAETLVLNNAWIANGTHSGGGIPSAPSAQLDDGLLDLVTVAHAGLLRRLWGLWKLRSEAFVDQPHVDYRRAHRVEVTAETPELVEVDGEPVGTLPATFDLLPSRLTVVC